MRTRWTGQYITRIAMYMEQSWWHSVVTTSYRLYLISGMSMHGVQFLGSLFLGSSLCHDQLPRKGSYLASRSLCSMWTQFAKVSENKPFNSLITITRIERPECKDAMSVSRCLIDITCLKAIKNALQFEHGKASTWSHSAFPHQCHESVMQTNDLNILILVVRRFWTWMPAE